MELLSGQPICVTACEATEYGEPLLALAGSLTISARRLTEGEMEALLRAERFDLVVDATHPLRCCGDREYRHRLLQCRYALFAIPPFMQCSSGGGSIRANTFHAAENLNQKEGNILLTTGSKEPSFYKSIRDFYKRAYARVLPIDTSLIAY